MSNLTQLIKDGTLVQVLVDDDNLPYSIINPTDNKVLGTTFNEEEEGIYMNDVRFRILGGKPVIEGTFKGRLELARANLSDGRGIYFDKDKKVFTDGEHIATTARMVQVVSGVIKIVIL